MPHPQPRPLMCLPGFRVSASQYQDEHRCPVAGDQNYWEQLGTVSHHLDELRIAPANLLASDLPIGMPITWSLFHGTFWRCKQALEARGGISASHRFTFDPLIASSYGTGNVGVFQPAAWRIFHVEAPETIFTHVHQGPRAARDRLAIAVPSANHRAATHPLAYQDRDLPRLAKEAGFDGYVTWDITLNAEREHLTVHVFEASLTAKVQLLHAVTSQRAAL